MNMASYGVTKTGFIIKPFQAILDEKAERAREMFGSDVDLRSTNLRRLGASGHAHAASPRCTNTRRCDHEFTPIQFRHFHSPCTLRHKIGR